MDEFRVGVFAHYRWTKYLSPEKPKPVTVNKPGTTSELFVTRQLRRFPLAGDKLLLLWTLREH